MLEHYVTFRKFFDEKHKAGEILFQGVVNIYNMSFAKHNDRGRSHAMMASHCEMKIKRDDRKASGGKSDLNWMAQMSRICLNSKTL